MKDAAESSSIGRVSSDMSDEQGLDDPRSQHRGGERGLTVGRIATGRFDIPVGSWRRKLGTAYELLGATLVAGLLLVGLLTAGVAEVYDSVTESNGVTVLDQPALRTAVALRTPAADIVVGDYTQLGDAVVLTLLAGATAIGLTLHWRRWTPIVLIAVTVAGSLMLTILGKAVVGRTRPPLADAVPPYEVGTSFPSGHSLNAMAIAGIVCYLLVRNQRSTWSRTLTVAAGALFVITIGLSRIYLGHHWLTDVVAAWAIGLAWVATVVVAHRLFLILRDVPRRPELQEHRQ
ncbi:MAG: phosphatase PAP2 family protein [Pseudonocardia sp.]